MNKEIYCIVNGEMLGQPFKLFAQTKARELGITGYVQQKTSADTEGEFETMEIVAQGTDENLQLFLSAVSIGPEEAPVDSMNFQKGPIEEAYTQFDIL